MRGLYMKLGLENPGGGGGRWLWRSGVEWKDNIKVHLMKRLCEDENDIEIGQDRVKYWAFVKIVMNHRF
jgi:hypothetical protein